jgi:hypothetical protein
MGQTAVITVSACFSPWRHPCMHCHALSTYIVMDEVLDTPPIASRELHDLPL